MRQMAYRGSRFYDALFKTESGQMLREVLRENLQEGDIVQIWIDSDASDFVYPWAWVYEKTVDPGDRYTYQKDLFWGYKYIIEQMPQFPETRSKELPSSIIQSDHLNVRVGVAMFEQTTALQKSYFARCSKMSGGHLEYTVWDDDKKWEAFLPNCNSQILYFFSHGHTAQPETANGRRMYDMAVKWKEWADRPLLEESERVRQYRKRALDIIFREIEQNELLLKETYIRLAKGYLLQRELNNLMDLWGSSPLVFLNMCESAQIFPSISGGLIDVFLKKGACGVIGTEMPMLDSFADLFARSFFDELFFEQEKNRSPLSVGNILLDLRRKFLDRGNPLGFAYTFFGDATARLSQSLPKNAEE